MPETTRYCHKCGEPCAWEDKFCTSCRAELRPTTPRPVTAPSEPQVVDRFNSEGTELGLPPNAVLLNRYRIRKELGVGGMGRVYLADDQKLGLPVAIKVLRDILRQDPGSVKRLISEAKASMILAHPNIVRMHNFEDGETSKFLVMEYVEGETLAHLIAREGKLPDDEVRRIAIEICKGLEHAHSKKVIHRDMKPGNVMLGKDGSIKIADFGIARLARDSMSRLTMQQDSGTLLYMAPEQLDGDSGELTDLYSLGIVMYEMLSGDPPFTTGEITAQIRHKAPREIPGVSPGLSGIVSRCLEKKPENRFPKIQVLREELEGKGALNRAREAELQQRIDRLSASAQRALEEGKYAEANSLYQGALELKPGDPALTEALTRAGQQQKDAEDVARREREQEEADRRAHLEDLKARVKQAFDAARWGEAIGILEEALALSPEDMWVKSTLAEARKKAEEAKKEYEWKKWIDAVLGQVNDLARLGKLQEAEKVLLQCLQHDPQNAPLKDLLAKIRERIAQALPQGKTEAGKEAAPKQVLHRPRPLRKTLTYTIGAAVLLFGSIILIAVIMEEPPPEPPKPPIGLAGGWNYVVTLPDGRSFNGQMQISGDSGQLQLVAAASYSALGADGYWHQFAEQNHFQGSFDGTNLVAQCFNGTFMMDGYQVPPPGLPIRINLTVSADGRSMQGGGSNTGGSFTITARRQDY